MNKIIIIDEQIKPLIVENTSIMRYATLKNTSNVALV